MSTVTRRIPAAGAALVLAALLAGCSSGPAVAAKDQPDTVTTTGSAPATPSVTPPVTPSTTPSAASASSDPAVPAGETSTAPVDSALEGTSWAGTDSDGDDYVYRFQPNGRFGYTSPNGTYDSAANTWSQSGNQVSISTTNGYATRIGTVQGDTISGTASNVRGHTWTWTAKRQ